MVDKLNAARQPAKQISLAFVTPEKDLIPEGPAYDAGEDCFYIGILYKSKIVKITRDGEVTDFTSSRQDSTVSVVGMKVDTDGRFLWASSSYGYKKDNIPSEELGTCEMVKYNLQTGELVDRYSVAKEENHFFNDVVLNSDKDAFITDSHVPAVYRIDHVENVIKKYVTLPDGSYPNGIALSENENFLYVAVRDGIIIVNIHDRSTKYLKHSEDIFTGGCDGLYFFKNSLTGILGFLSRVVRFHLNENMNEVVSIEVLESYNPEFETPTTGAIAGNEFYYIANAQLGKIDRDGNLAPIDQLNEVKILKVNL
ncbi:SMP-30/gluconolactonase/LRE family protein, partial [bacterium]|nr:SMP-30/gluconolactonase/LRE family protein [bacterium]